MARFHSDECFPLPVVEELRRIGHDVLTAAEAGRAGRGIPDDRVLAFATSDGRAVLTHNRRHYIRLHRLKPGHAGIVSCKRDQNAVTLAARIHAAVTAAPSIAGLLVRVYRPSLP